MSHPLYALTAARERRGLSTEVLAERAGVSLRSVRRLEQGGRPHSYATWQRLADVLRVVPITLWHRNGRYADDACPLCRGAVCCTRVAKRQGRPNPS